MKLVRRLIGAAGVSVLIAGGVMFAASPTAQAYDPKVWDKVAFCESTNRWSVNTGNGYYGGLQFSRTTWLEFGGGTYAKFANQATKAEQIAVARRVLAVQGPGAWPVCSQRAGLTKTNGGADRNAKPGQGGGSSKPAPAPAKPSKPSGTVVTVRGGDTLSAIARRHNVNGGWQAIAKTNSLSNPNYIRIGQRLVLP